MKNDPEEKIFEFNINKGRKFVGAHYWQIFASPTLLALLITSTNKQLYPSLIIILFIFPFLYLCHTYNKKTAHKLVFDFTSNTVTFFKFDSEIPVNVKFTDINKIYYNNYLLFYTNHGKIFFKDTTDKNSVICASKIRNLSWGCLSYLGNINKNETESFTKK